MSNKFPSYVKPFLFGLSFSVLVLASAIGGALADRLFVFKPLNYLLNKSSLSNLGAPNAGTSANKSSSLINTEDNVINISEKASKSVVTVSIKRKAQTLRQSPFDMFGFGMPVPSQDETPTDLKNQDIGTGFVVDSKAGLILTNKHVISDTDSEYFVEDQEGKEYPIKNLYRDPANDIGIIRIDAQLPGLELGDSDSLKVGQSVVAIGTALGEFRHTVTTGVISGLGRGITASDGYGFSSERLDNVIQTDAAINPGNSGGPLLNSQGQVIGVNSAVAGNAQNIGFAIPINVIKESLKNFNESGKFERPFFGVQYQMIPQKTAIMNSLPEGAYVVDVVPGSSASDAGLKTEDVITKFGDTDIKEKTDLAKIINQKKIGDKVKVEYWRNGEKNSVEITLKERKE